MLGNGRRVREKEMRRAERWDAMGYIFGYLSQSMDI